MEVDIHNAFLLLIKLTWSPFATGYDTVLNGSEKLSRNTIAYLLGKPLPATIMSLLLFICIVSFLMVPAVFIIIVLCCIIIIIIVEGFIIVILLFCASLISIILFCLFTCMVGIKIYFEYHLKPSQRDVEV